MYLPGVSVVCSNTTVSRSSLKHLHFSQNPASVIGQGGDVYTASSKCRSCYLCKQEIVVHAPQKSSSGFVTDWAFTGCSHL